MAKTEAAKEDNIKLTVFKPEIFLESDLVTDTTAVHTALPCGIQQTGTLTTPTWITCNARCLGLNNHLDDG